MQWDATPGAGFTSGRPWLRLAPDAATRNVALELRDPDSVLAAYRRLLDFRRTSRALRTGSMRRLEAGTPDVLVWTRTAPGEMLLALVNFVGQERTVRLPEAERDGVPLTQWEPVVGSHRMLGNGGAPSEELALRPDEAVILAGRI